MPGIFNGIRVFGMELSTPVLPFLRFGKYLVCLKHKDQTPTGGKCNRPGPQARTCPNIFCFNCEELEHLTDFCPNEVHCCICRVTGHMAADCFFSWNRRSSVLRTSTSYPPVQHPSQLSTTPTQSSEKSTESSGMVFAEQYSQFSDQSMQPSQQAPMSSESSNFFQHSRNSQSLLPSEQSSLSTQLSQQFSESSAVDSQAPSSSQQSLQSSDQLSHLSSNAPVQSKRVADLHSL